MSLEFNPRTGEFEEKEDNKRKRGGCGRAIIKFLKWYAIIVGILFALGLLISIL